MRAYQYRRKRPTTQTANEFFKIGHFGTDPTGHYLSGDEREAEIEKVGDELDVLFRAQFPRTQNLEFAILKGHLIVEYALVQYIRCFAAVSVPSEQINFTFRQKLEIAYLLGFGANNPTVLPTVERLNKVRNQVAHTFSLDRAAFDEMLRFNSSKYDYSKPKSDRDRIRQLRPICMSICARVAGEAQAAHSMARLDQEAFRAYLRKDK